MRGFVIHKRMRSGLALVAGALLLLLGEFRPVLASGCLISDRPVLSHSFSWDRTEDDPVPGRIPHHGGLRKVGVPRGCPGETPAISKSRVPITGSSQIQFVVDVALDGSQPVGFYSDICPLNPLCKRLERPPR